MLGTAAGAKQSSSKGANSGPLAFVRDSHFMTTTQVRPVVSTRSVTLTLTLTLTWIHPNQMLYQFAGQKQKPPPGARVVYVDGGCAHPIARTRTRTRTRTRIRT